MIKFETYYPRVLLEEYQYMAISKDLFDSGFSSNYKNCIDSDSD